MISFLLLLLYVKLFYVCLITLMSYADSLVNFYGNIGKTLLSLVSLIYLIFANWYFSVIAILPVCSYCYSTCCIYLILAASESQKQVVPNLTLIRNFF